MPKKYEGEEERPPRKRGKLEALLKKDPELIGEMRKLRGKVREFDPPAQKSGLLRNTLRKPIDPSAPKKKRTFKYKPMA